MLPEKTEAFKLHCFALLSPGDASLSFPFFPKTLVTYKLEIYVQ